MKLFPEEYKPVEPIQLHAPLTFKERHERLRKSSLEYDLFAQGVTVLSYDVPLTLFLLFFIKIIFSICHSLYILCF